MLNLRRDAGAKGAGRIVGPSLLLAVLGVPALALADVEHSPPGHTCLNCGGALTDPGGDGDGDVAFFELSTRWSSTFLSGAGLVQGQPTMITWSIVPDGTDIAGETPNSSLIAALDAEFGAGGGGADLTNRPWFFMFEDSFARWSELAGLDYQYVTDDGAQHNGTNAGSATRGDVRIGAVDFGSSGVIAYNYFPNRGDMVIDTDDISVGFALTANNHVWARNVIMHEHGHGIGINHLESSTNDFLMEPFINDDFDGPQFDDILSAQRHYGDVLEKNGGNDTAATAFDFGLLTEAVTVAIGTDATDAVVAAGDTDFVSIDDDSDVDFYSFTIDALNGITIDLTPMGPTYNEGAQGGAQTAFDTSALANLTLTLFDTDGTSILAFANAAGLGGDEQILFPDLLGTYFVQVAGLDNMIQMYQLGLTAGPVPEPGSALLAMIGGGFLLARRRRVA